MAVVISENVDFFDEDSDDEDNVEEIEAHGFVVVVQFDNADDFDAGSDGECNEIDYEKCLSVLLGLNYSYQDLNFAKVLNSLTLNEVILTVCSMHP